MRMTAITIRVWIQPPVCGKLGLIRRPKNPRSHKIIKITMMVHNMRFLLFELFAQYEIMAGGLSASHQLQGLEPTSL